MLHKLAAVKVIRELEVQEMFNAEEFEVKNPPINFQKEITDLALRHGIVIFLI